MKDVLISVIVPVYNSDKYLKQCLDSIINQTYRALDIVLIDDGSVDKSGDICDEYALIDNRVRVFHTENNGISAARNYGLERAREKEAEYVCWSDSDDWMEPNMIAELADSVYSSKSDIAVCGYYMEYFNRSITISLHDNLNYNLQSMIELLSEKYGFALWNKMFRLSLFDDILFPVGKYYEDAMTIYRVFEKADSVISISQVLYHYRQVEASIVHLFCVKRLFDRWDYAKMLYDYSDRKNFLEIDEIRLSRLGLCASVALECWLFFSQTPAKERKLYRDDIKSISLFVKNHLTIYGFQKWSFKKKMIMLIPRYASSISFFLAKMLWIRNKRHQTLQLFG